MLSTVSTQFTIALHSIGFNRVMAMNLTMNVYRVISVSVPELGAKIKATREKDSRSLSAICREAGMSRESWYKIEAERQDLPIETLRKIEQVLGVDFGIEV